jgi:hypothetical protein
MPRVLEGDEREEGDADPSGDASHWWGPVDDADIRKLVLVKKHADGSSEHVLQGTRSKARHHRATGRHHFAVGATAGDEHQDAGQHLARGLGGAQCSEVVAGSVSIDDPDNAGAEQVSKDVAGSVSIEGVVHVGTVQVDAAEPVASSEEETEPEHEHRKRLQLAGGLHEPAEWRGLQFVSREREQRATRSTFNYVAAPLDEAALGAEQVEVASFMGAEQVSDAIADSLFIADVDSERAEEQDDGYSCDAPGPRELCNALSSFGDRLVEATEAGERCTEKRCQRWADDLLRFEGRAALYPSDEEIRANLRGARECLQTIVEGGLDSDSDDDTGSWGDLRDEGDGDWTSFLSGSDVASFLAVSRRISAVSIVHAMHLARGEEV